MDIIIVNFGTIPSSSKERFFKRSSKVNFNRSGALSALLAHCDIYPLIVTLSHRATEWTKDVTQGWRWRMICHIYIMILITIIWTTVNPETEQFHHSVKYNYSCKRHDYGQDCMPDILLISIFCYHVWRELWKGSGNCTNQAFRIDTWVFKCIWTCLFSSNSLPNQFEYIAVDGPLGVLRMPKRDCDSTNSYY